MNLIGIKLEFFRVVDLVPQISNFLEGSRYKTYFTYS